MSEGIIPKTGSWIEDQGSGIEDHGLRIEDQIEDSHNDDRDAHMETNVCFGQLTCVGQP